MALDKDEDATDMFFVVRQLVEKALEHQTKQYLIFVDLHKAYDSVLHEAMWVALRKLSGGSRN